MTGAGAALRVLALVLALACYGSFTWAVLGLFRRRGPTPGPMRWVGVLGTLFFLLQVAALLLRTPAPGFAMAGVLLYLGALGLFWWAVPYARSARLGLAFTGEASATLLEDGPYRWVRHPFYAAYLLFWLAGAAASGEPWLLVSVVVMGAFYLAAIRREEQELLARPDLPGYAAYRARTGCVVPRWPHGGGRG